MLRSPLFYSMVFLLATGVFFAWCNREPSRGSPPQLGLDEPLPSASRAASSSLVSSANVRASRNPSGKGALPPGLTEFEAESTGHWSVTANADGHVVRFSDGSFPSSSENPEQSAKAFLARFSLGLFGVPADRFSILSSTREAGTSQVVFGQTLNSLPVLGSRVNLIFDANGNLIYGIADVYGGSAPPAIEPLVSPDAAASLARSSTLHYLGLTEDAGSYPAAFFKDRGSLAYRWNGNSISLVYHYKFSLLDGREGDMEMLIDAREGAVTQLRNLSRK